MYIAVLSIFIFKTTIVPAIYHMLSSVNTFGLHMVLCTYNNKNNKLALRSWFTLSVSNIFCSLFDEYFILPYV
ncbi:Protein of unknown function [Gryllus bimaculatus]|nr:Protein of unknown function [Gryllus bimaculatus]